MPRKTRRQKELADSRKKAVTPMNFNFTATSTMRKEMLSDTSFVYIRNDIRKTLILGGLFILFELSLAFII